eukprot:Clim_evm4s9 gene=Clim_evmTU4s9
MSSLITGAHVTYKLLRSIPNMPPHKQRILKATIAVLLIYIGYNYIQEQFLKPSAKPAADPPPVRDEDALQLKDLDVSILSDLDSPASDADFKTTYYSAVLKHAKRNATHCTPATSSVRPAPRSKAASALRPRTAFGDIQNSQPSQIYLPDVPANLSFRV